MTFLRFHANYTWQKTSMIKCSCYIHTYVLCSSSTYVHTTYLCSSCCNKWTNVCCDRIIVYYLGTYIYTYEVYRICNNICIFLGWTLLHLWDLVRFRVPNIWYIRYLPNSFDYCRPTVTYNQCWVRYFKKSNCYHYRQGPR